MSYQPIGEQPTINPNWLGYISASWLTPIMRLSKKGELSEHNLLKLHEKDTAITISRKFDWFWDEAKKCQQDPSRKKPSMYYVLFSSIFFSFTGSALANVIGTALTLIEPIFLQQMILYLEGRQDIFISNGFVLAAILVVLQFGRSLATSYEILTSRRYSQIMQSLFVTGLYQKSLRLSLSSRAKYSEGKIMNLINQDVPAIKNAVFSLDSILVMPPQIVFTMYMLYILLGNAAFVSFGIVAIIATITAIISPKIGKTYSAWIEAGDKRLAIVREMLYAIKVVKYETLEGYFKRKIGMVRNDQVKSLKREFVYGCTLEVMVTSSVIIMIAGTFAAYSLLGNQMSASVIFPAILYFTKLENPLDLISWVISANMAGIKSMQRVHEFLLAEEMDLKHNEEGDGSLVASNASFAWEKVEKEAESTDETTPLLEESGNVFSLNNINLNIKPGTTVGIVGAVGAGKSTLLSSIIGEVNLASGALKVNGSVAYCNQQPWILTGSVEKNILFNSEKNSEWLNTVVKMCGLEKDLTQLANGLDTEIGENGVNLSGGQKARVALARAIYSNADIYLLDDPLAALDAHVGKQVFKNAVQGLLKHKTVLLATHQLQYLNQLDRVVVMENGEIAESGTYVDLIESKGKLSQMIQNHTIEEPELDHHEEEVDVATKDDKVESFIEEEERNVGKVSLKVYFDFFKAVGGYAYPIAFFALTIATCFVQIVTPLLLTWWTSSVEKEGSFDKLILYSAFSGAQVLIGAAFQIVCLFMAIKAACNIHDFALNGLLSAPLSFFDQNPIGRILNRFSSDVEKLDRSIGYHLMFITLHVVTLICNLVLIALSNFYIMGLFALIAIFTYNWFLLFRPSNLDLQRMLSVSNSPLDAHISETLAGIAVVRAYKQESKFIDIQMELIDKMLAISYTKQSLMVWFKFRVNMMATCVTLFVVSFALRSANASAEYISLIGLALTRTSALAGMILNFMIVFGYFEASMNSVERLSHYSQNLPEEKAALLDTDPVHWPTKGKVEIKNLELRYPTRPDYPVVKNLSITISPGEKIGVVGRTGSGKSTLAAAFFRIMEPSSGTILIDDVDICKIGINSLRKSIQMIPQEPVLFEGTFRSNLDVEGEFTDEQLWEALDHSGLKDYVSSLTEKLEAPITPMVKTYQLARDSWLA
ncbi:Multidrug resistance-associated protein 1 [Terramyces sp. JEL0728]|nr:Multidrug resistance-associated protein 1 [Terramyces sp. JEL0728]